MKKNTNKPHRQIDSGTIFISEKFYQYASKIISYIGLSFQPWRKRTIMKYDRKKLKKADSAC